MSFIIGKCYNWKHQHERLVYMGQSVSNGIWYQFAKVETPNKCWCEVSFEDLGMIEETAPNNK